MNSLRLPFITTTTTTAKSATAKSATAKSATTTTGFRPGITSVVDWALKIKYLSTTIITVVAD